MILFSEIYGVYFRIAAKVLSRESMTEKEITDIITKNGFNDSILFLPQKLLPSGGDWGLLRKSSTGFTPVLKHKPAFIPTRLQKMWLKAMLSDPRINLFLTAEEKAALDQKLADIKPLFLNNHFFYTDRFSDGDDYSNENYIKAFRTILAAVKEKRILNIQFTSGHGRRIAGHFVPLKIEYSPKNDKFRVYCYWLKKGKIINHSIINIGRIDRVNATDRTFARQLSEKSYFAAERCKEPIVVKVTPERNAIERFMPEFASYKKHTDRDLETGVCTVKMWYENQDETEMLIRLLSYGPVLEILGPPAIRKQAAERIAKQKDFTVDSQKIALYNLYSIKKYIGG